MYCRYKFFSCVEKKGGQKKMKESVQELYSKEQIDKRVEEIAEQINKDYEGKTLHMICILRGSVFFFSDLAKKVKVPVTIDFMAASSYGSKTVSSGDLQVRKDLDDDLDGLEVLIVEDIIDTGSTLDMIQRMLKARNPASLKICTLLDKPDRRETDVALDYVGFQIPDKFVVGYGLDYAQKYRNLPYIGVLDFIEE